MIGSQPFDVVISDIRMTGADAMAVLTETRPSSPTPITRGEGVDPIL
jgi:DNA-binding NtrC family response regulator